MTAAATEVTPAATGAGGRRFRPEIEGLRAVAAILVAVYHVFLGRVSGGVDVFFVVAGFLITTTLLGHLDRSGRVQPDTYLSRLATRLVPMAFLVLAVVLVASIAWVPVTRLDAVLKEIAASALYVENWALAMQSVDYLAREGPLSPVQHFWALSVQGQFYLVWLGLFATVALVARRLRRDARGVLLAGLVLLFAGSLAFSVYLTAQNQPLAYFHTGTRVWEFAAGGLLAVLLPRLTGIARLPAWAGVAGGWIGIAMIISCGLLIPVSSSFPGWIAMWPIAGGLLVMLAGDAPGADRRWSSTSVLASRPFVFLGGVSYAIYLWHWPILIFYRLRAGDEAVQLLPGVLIIGSAIALAIVTTRLVERPVRSWVQPARRPWRTVLAGGIAMGMVAMTAFAVFRWAPGPAAASATFGSVDYPGAAAMEPGFVYAGGDVPFAPDPLRAQRDLPEVHRNGCHVRLGAEGRGASVATSFAAVIASDVCSFGDPDSDTTIVLVGGSHAMQWFTALRPIAEERGWHLLSATKSGCRFSGDPQGETAEGRSCAAWNEEALAGLIAMRPDLVVTTATVTGAHGERIEDGAIDYWRRLGEAGIEVAAIRDNPRWPSTPVDCLAIHMDDPGRCTVARSQSMDAVSPTGALDPPPDNVTFIDLTDYMCAGDVCPAVVGNVVTNYDANHLTATFVRTLAPMLRERLPPVP